MEISAPASFAAPSQVVFQLLLSGLSVSVANHGGDVRDQESRWRLSNKWGAHLVCGGSVCQHEDSCRGRDILSAEMFLLLRGSLC